MPGHARDHRLVGSVSAVVAAVRDWLAATTFGTVWLYSMLDVLLVR